MPAIAKAVSVTSATEEKLHALNGFFVLEVVIVVFIVNGVL